MKNQSILLITFGGGWGWGGGEDEENSNILKPYQISTDKHFMGI